MPKLDEDVERLTQIPGQPPSLLRPPSGCRFHPRCSYSMDVCVKEEPGLDPVAGEQGHLARCWLDQATKDREAEKFAAERVTEAV
jgi:peptide/nickel transport system ATP-binding protein